MSEGSPRVTRLEGRPSPAPKAEPGAGASTAAPRRGPWLWLLLAALLASAAGWALALGQGRELSAALAAQEEALAVQEAALAQARERLGAYEAHVGDVRERVRALAGELSQLEALLEGGPDDPLPGAGTDQ